MVESLIPKKWVQHTLQKIFTASRSAGGVSHTSQRTTRAPLGFEVRSLTLSRQWGVYHKFLTIAHSGRRSPKASNKPRQEKKGKGRKKA